MQGTVRSPERDVDAEMHLHEPPALLDCRPGEPAEPTHQVPATQMAPLKEACCDLSHQCWTVGSLRAGQTLGLMSVSLTGARPGNQHAGPTSKLVRPSAP